MARPHLFRTFTATVSGMLGIALLVVLPARAQIPDIWEPIEIDPSVFPEGYMPPTEYQAFSLNEVLLGEVLEAAPRESFGEVPSDIVIPLPLPDGMFANAAVSKSSLMDSTLASQYPEIGTFVLHNPDGQASGHLVTGPDGAHFAAVAGGHLFWIQPVATRIGPVYLSYFDHDRGDGANDATTIHPDTAGDGDPDPVPVPILGPTPVPPVTTLGSPGLVATKTLTSGTQLRIYRLAAATTAEFYQARGGNNLSVVISILVDLIGTNAVFESEIATRLVLVAASLDVFYDDPTTAPFFNAPPQCAVGGVPNGTMCTSDDDCDTDNGEACNIRTTCQLRDDNRDNMIALNGDGTVPHGEYDLSVLFAVSRPGVRGGCAWYVVCLEGNTNHKARGMVTAGSGGTGSTSGVLAHEVGHMLGARHTFTGVDGSCTLNEFFAGDSESGYEPGSGTTRMSYSGNCDSDNVDTSADPPSDPYFHSRSFDEIIDNIFNGDGSNCGSLVNTANQPPSVNAGDDYTIPRMTPFVLTPQSHSDDQPLSFNWEQYDRAILPRPIDTDFINFLGFIDFGPIIRSVPPVSEPSRTIPNLADLLDGTSQPPLSINRAGEMLPQVDRELNFRFIARDDQVGGGGVAYDTMTVTVEGDPFYVTYPNGGEFLNAGCTAVASWEVGGSSVAPVNASHVDITMSEDGGQSFPLPFLTGTENDGGQAGTLPCVDSDLMRMRAQGVDNIFFDISDGNFEIMEEAPQVAGSAIGGEVDAQCEFTVTVNATVADDCGVAEGDVMFTDISLTTANASLGVPDITISQVNDFNVDVSASVLVFDLTSSPAQVRFDLSATDNCGLLTTETWLANVSDTIPPTIEVELDPDSLWPPNHKMAEITADVTVEDNCPIVSFVLDGVTSDEPDNGAGDGDTVNDIQDTQINTPDLSFLLRAERMGGGDGRTYTATYTAEDGSGNTASDSATVEVPKNQN